MKSIEDFVNDALLNVDEWFPWDLEEALDRNEEHMLIDVREPYEYDAMHIKQAINVPRGILETACDYNYEETIPDLVNARDSSIVVICRSGKRSALAAQVMQEMGYNMVRSLKTGMRGWSDADLLMVDAHNEIISEEAAIEYFTAKVNKDQMTPRSD